MDASHASPRLARVLGFWALVAFGVGDILGAGIYALVGKVAGLAGAWAWAGFIVAMVVAGFTALSYGELARRLPHSGGEATFCNAAFRRPRLAVVVGWLVLCSGVVSMATVSRSAAGYLQALWPVLPTAVVIVAFLGLLTALNLWGMRESSLANIGCTLIELSGLVIVIVVSLTWLAGRPDAPAPAAVSAEWPWRGILSAGAIAFFAFIGFEDMVNVADEVHAPERTLPAAILTALGLAGVLYIVVSWLATAVLPAPLLAASDAPLLDVVRVAQPHVPAELFTLIALIAVSNTALLNFVMASRLLYGMADRGLLPRALARVHPRRRTPHLAILLVGVVAVGLALSGTLVALAGTTSVLILTVFAVVNLSLVVLKRRGEGAGEGFRVPSWVPWVGAGLSVALLLFVPPQAALRALLVAMIGVLIVITSRSLGRLGVDQTE